MGMSVLCGEARSIRCRPLVGETASERPLLVHVVFSKEGLFTYFAC